MNEKLAYKFATEFILFYPLNHNMDNNRNLFLNIKKMMLSFSLWVPRKKALQGRLLVKSAFVM